ncbi:MAG: hypothetical protein AAF907_04120, partial [Planctomycetota bacterium]
MFYYFIRPSLYFFTAMSRLLIAACCSGLLAGAAFARHDHGMPHGAGDHGHGGHGHGDHAMPGMDGGMDGGMAAAGMAMKKPEPPTVFLDKSPRIVAFQLKRLDDTRLLMVERKTTDPKYLPVYEAILTRPGVSPKERAAALAGLVELNGSDRVSEILRVLDPLESDDRAERRMANQLTTLLLEAPADFTSEQIAALKEAIQAENPPKRVAAFAGLIAAGESDQAFQPALGASELMRDYLAAIPKVPDEAVRSNLRQGVVTMLDSTDPAVVRQAVATLGAIPAGPADTFNRVAPLLNDESLRPTAIRTLLTVPAETRDPQVSAEA